MEKNSLIFLTQGVLIQAFNLAILFLTTSRLVKTPWLFRFAEADVAFYVFPDILVCISIGCWPLALGLLPAFRTHVKRSFVWLAALLVFAGLWMNLWAWLPLGDPDVRLGGAVALTVGVVIMFFLTLGSSNGRLTGTGRSHIVAGLIFLSVGGVSMIQAALDFVRDESPGVSALTDRPIFAAVFYLTGVLGMFFGILQERVRPRLPLELLSLVVYVAGSVTFTIGFWLSETGWSAIANSYWFVVGVASLFITLLINGLILGLSMKRTTTVE